VSGTHGAWHGNNWDDTGARDASLHEQAFLSEDIESRLSGHFAPNPAGVFEGYHGGIKVMGDLIGFILKRDSKNGLEYYVSTSAKKGSFESRIRIYDGAKMTEPDVRGLIANLGNHVILGYCFSRNDEALRYKGAATPSAPVTSFDSPKELPLGFAPGYGIFARPRTFITDGGSTTPVPVGAFIEDVPGRGNRLKITGPGSRPTITGPYPELWLPPSFSPLDPQAPTEAVYNKHHP
jgi:hypothetical protein